MFFSHWSKKSAFFLFTLFFLSLSKPAQADVVIYSVSTANLNASFSQVVNAEVSSDTVSCNFKYKNNGGSYSGNVPMKKSVTIPQPGRLLFSLTTFIPAGSNSATVQCYDQLGNGAVKYYDWKAVETPEMEFGVTIYTVKIDSELPGARTFSVAGALNTNNCNLRIDSTDHGAMIKKSTPTDGKFIFTKAVTIAAGNHSATVQCYDYYSNGAVRHYDWIATAPASTPPPVIDDSGVTIYKVYPANQKSSFNQIMYAEVSANTVSCKFRYSNNDGPDITDRAMEKSSTVPSTGKALFSLTTFIAAGSNEATVQCYDQLSNGAVKHYNWTATSVPETEFGNQTYGLTIDSKNIGSRTLTVITSLNTDNCSLRIDRAEAVAMIKSTSAPLNRKAFTFTTNITTGEHEAIVNCYDYYSNSASDSVYWTAAPTPSVIVNAASNSAGQWTISASAPFCNESASVLEKKCAVYVNGTNKGVMNETGTDTGVFSTSLPLTTGTHAVVVKCTNAAGVSASGSKQVTVASPTTQNLVLSPTINSVSRSGSDTNPFTITINATGGNTDSLTCGALIDNQDAGEFESAGLHIYEMTDVVVPSGSHNFTFICYDSNYRYTTKQQTWSFAQLNENIDEADDADDSGYSANNDVPSNTIDQDDDEAEDTSSDDPISDNSSYADDIDVSEEVPKDTDDYTDTSSSDTSNEYADDDVSDDASLGDSQSDDSSSDSESSDSPLAPAPRVSSGGSTGSTRTAARPRTTATIARSTPASIANTAVSPEQGAVVSWIAERISPVTRISTSTPTTASPFRASPAVLPLKKAFSIFTFISEHKLAIGATLAALCTFTLAGVIILIIVNKKK